MESLPFVSVVMPIRNEKSFIEKSLKSVLEQNYPAQRMEILIADGMSEDGTREIVRKFQNQYPQIKLVDNPKKIVSSGLNLAIRQAQGKIIIRVDGHTIINAEFISECVSTLQNSTADNVGGPTNAVGVDRLSQSIALATLSLFGGIGGVRLRHSSPQNVETVFLGAWKRELFDRIGFFDEEMIRNQDDEFNYRILDSGGRILLTPKIRSQYYVRSTLGALWKQYFQYGFWKVRVMQKHPGQMRFRQFVPALFVLSLCLSLLGASFTPAGKVVLAALGGAYVFLDFLFSFWISLRNGFKHFVFLLIVYPVLHFAYGLGFLTGVVYFLFLKDNKRCAL